MPFKGTTGVREPLCGGSKLPHEDVSMVDEGFVLFGSSVIVFGRDVVAKVGTSAVDSGSLVSGTASKSGMP